jgi:hypothetical protein
LRFPPLPPQIQQSSVQTRTLAQQGPRPETQSLTTPSRFTAQTELFQRLPKIVFCDFPPQKHQSSLQTRALALQGPRPRKPMSDNSAAWEPPTKKSSPNAEKPFRHDPQILPKCRATQSMIRSQTDCSKLAMPCRQVLTILRLLIRVYCFLDVTHFSLFFMFKFTHARNV